MSAYQKGKENARQAAIDYQGYFSESLLSWGEIAYYTAYFMKIARRYGLITEFRENGII